MSILDNVYLVNLDNRKDRLLFMNYKLQELGINYTRISAVLGSNHSREYNNYMRQLSKRNIDRNMNINSLGAYGILLTYKFHISPLYMKNKQITIFEDDCFFHKDFNNLLEKYEPIIKYCDIVWLGCQQVRWTDNMLKEVNTKGYCNTNRNTSFLPYGAYGIVYSSRFLKILNYELNKNWDTPNIRNVDIFITLLLNKYRFLKSICIHPNLVIPQVFESDNMGPRDIYKMCEARKWDLSLYKYSEVTGHFCDLYKKVINSNISLRQLKKNKYHDINNIDISKVIENKNKSFVFIITSYNNEKWVNKNIKSIVNQNYPFWRIIYIDDCSEDKTINKLNEIVKLLNISNKIRIFKNSERKSQSFNRWYASKLCQNDEICCMLDGDDWLVDDANILEKLNRLYLDNKLLMSYGQFYYYKGDYNSMELSGTDSYSENDIIHNNYRHKWCTQHLRTMEASLMKSIPEEYLKLDGKFITVCTDMAEMYWCLERSHGKHMNTGFPTVVYNKLASMSYDNSYYNKDKNIKHAMYRKKVTDYLKSHTFNSGFHLQPDCITDNEDKTIEIFPEDKTIEIVPQDKAIIEILSNYKKKTVIDKDEYIKNILRQLYREILFRNPDHEGLMHYVNKYNNGMSIRLIRYNLMNSSERKNLKKNHEKTSRSTIKTYRHYGFNTYW